MKLYLHHKSQICYVSIFNILAADSSLFQRGAMNNRRLAMVAIAYNFKP